MSRALRARAVELSRRRFVRDVGALWSAQGIVIVATLVQGIVVARLLGPAGYGIAGLIMAYPSVAKELLATRSVDVTVRYVGEFVAGGRPDRARAIARLGYLVDGTVALGAFGLVAATAGWGADHLVDHDGAAGLMILYSAGLALDAPYATSRGVLAAFGRFSLSARVLAIAAVVRSVASIGLVVGGYGVAGVIWAGLIALATESVILTVFAHRVLAAEVGGGARGCSVRVLRGRGREIARFLGYSELTTSIELVVKQGDLIILGLVSNPVDVGYYRLAKSLTSVSNNIQAPLQHVVYPRFSQAWVTGGRPSLARVVRQFALKAALPVGAASLLILPVVPFVVVLIAGGAFRGAGVITQWFVVGSAVAMACCWVRPAMLAVGDVRYWFGNRLALVVSSLLGYVLLVPRWGAVGMAVTHVLTTISLYALGIVRLIRRHLAADGTVNRPPDIHTTNDPFVRQTEETEPLR